MRKLLVQCAHHTLGQWGKDSALRQWGLTKSGGSASKKRAVIAVARKLAVLNNMAGLLIDGGLTSNTQELHQPGYSNSLLATNKEVSKTLRPSIDPIWNPQLARLHEKELEKRNHNRATLAVARKLVAYLLAVDRGERPFAAATEPTAAA